MLFNVCKQVNQNTHFISSTKELNPEWIKSARSIGICGATSTPKWLMEETKKRFFCGDTFQEHKAGWQAVMEQGPLPYSG